MGNSQDSSSEPIHFVQTLSDKNFGELEIYRNEAGKFIMKEQRTFIHNPDDPKYQHFKQLLVKFQKFTHSNHQQSQYFVPIIFSKNSVKTNLCIVYETVEIYCQYFNHTLLDLAISKVRLVASEIWMCFKWMLQLIQIIQKNGWSIEGQLNLDKIFVTPRGRIVFYSNFLKGNNIPQRKQPLTKETEAQEIFKQTSESILIRQAISCILSLICQQTISEPKMTSEMLKRCLDIDPILAKLLQNLIDTQKQDITSQLCCQNILELINHWIKDKKVNICREIVLNRMQLHKQASTETPKQANIDKSRNKADRVTPIKIVHRPKTKYSCSITKRTDRQSLTSNQITDRVSALKNTTPFSQTSDRFFNKQNKLINSVEEKINGSGMAEKTMKMWLTSKKVVKSNFRNNESANLNKENLLQNSIHLLSTCNRRQSFKNKSKGQLLRRPIIQNSNFNFKINNA